MTYQEAIEIVVDRYHHERHRWLVSDENPEREQWRQKIIAMASDIRNPKPKPRLPPQAADASFPSLMVQAGNAMGALSRAAGQLLSGNALLVSPKELDRRLAICRACDQYKDMRCLKCGCVVALKAKLESETGQCPLKKW
jgi:hypothetical protein